MSKTYLYRQACWRRGDDVPERGSIESPQELSLGMHLALNGGDRGYATILGDYGRVLTLEVKSVRPEVKVIDVTLVR
jgi:hypothetical protein